VILQITDTLSQSPVPLHNPPLGSEETVTRENRLLEVLTKNGQLQASLVGNHTDVVQMPLGVVQQGLCVAKVATERSVNGGLVGKTVGVDSPVVLVASAKKLVIVEVDEARDSVSQNMHESIAPSAVDHLKGELLRSRRDLLPTDLANDPIRQLSGTLLEQTVTPHLRARASEARSQLHQVALKDEHVLVGTNLTVCSRSFHLHKILR
jgi:hypothetical protein